MVENKRRIYFIEKKFQAQFIIKFCLLVILGSIITVSLLYFMTSRTTIVSFENTKAVVKSTADYIFPILAQTVIVVTILIAIFTIMLTLFISHKIGGPLYRFKKEFKIIEDGDLSSDFRIREKDQLQDLAGALNKMKLKLRDFITEFKSDIQELESTIATLELNQEQLKALEDKVKKIKDKLKHFKK